MCSHVIPEQLSPMAWIVPIELKFFERVPYGFIRIARNGVQVQRLASRLLSDAWIAPI
jgi:hypothetical protein